jgi:hypothetical protein
MEYPYPYPTYEMQHQPKPHHDEQGMRNTYNHGVDGKCCSSCILQWDTNWIVRKWSMLGLVSC